jgi:hypothetical protein
MSAGGFPPANNNPFLFGRASCAILAPGARRSTAKEKGSRGPPDIARDMVAQQGPRGQASRKIAQRLGIV